MGLSYVKYRAVGLSSDRLLPVFSGVFLLAICFYLMLFVVSAVTLRYYSLPLFVAIRCSSLLVVPASFFYSLLYAAIRCYAMRCLAAASIHSVICCNSLLFVAICHHSSQLVVVCRSSSLFASSPPETVLAADKTSVMSAARTSAVSAARPSSRKTPDISTLINGTLQGHLRRGWLGC